MANFENVPSSFFMFYTDDFQTKLSIPVEFGDECSLFLRQVSFNLKTTHPPRSWAVKARKRNGEWCINNGWSKFATDNNLVAGNLLAFRIVGESALEVSIFREGSCLEEPPSPPPSSPSESESDASSDEDDEAERPAITWRFVKQLKHYHFKIARMEVPCIFAWATGISTKLEIKVENEAGRRWPVKVTDRNMNVYSFTGGWFKVVKDNDFKIGNYLLFESIPDSRNVVKVVKLRKKFGKKLVAKARKGGLIMD